MNLSLSQVYKKVITKYEIKLITGERGLEKPIEWVHVIEDEQVSGFLSGNELVFTTGIGHCGNKWLINFIHGLKENKACGLVVNVGRYIDDIPQEAIVFCKEQNFPLFVIPWPVKIVDMSRYICHMIIEKEQTEISISNAFCNAIFSPSKAELYKTQLERYGFSWIGNYNIVLSPLKENKNYITTQFYHEIDG